MIVLESKRITCYQDREGQILILPWARVGFSGKATAQVQHVSPSVSNEELGKHVREQTVFCDMSFCDPNVINPLVLTTGLRTMKAFANRWSSVVVYFEDQIRVSPTSRDSKGAYWELFRETSSLPLDSSDRALGDRIREAFTRCKLGRRDY